MKAGWLSGIPYQPFPGSGHSWGILHLASLMDILDPSANVITVTGMRCVGVPIGTPEFVQAYVRAKAVEICNDVQKLSIITDPKLHYDLLRFCQHTRLGFLSRTLSPDVLRHHRTTHLRL
jgi:hypothetical protein